MNMSSSRYNLICYGHDDHAIFHRQSGGEIFPRDRMFEYTDEKNKAVYGNDLAGLSDLPALVVAEAVPGGNYQTPAFLSRIEKIREAGTDVRFDFRHLYGNLTSEEIFGCGIFNIDIRKTGSTGQWGENARMHWAVKEGDLIEEIFRLLERRSQESRSKFFRVDCRTPTNRAHIAVMMPFAREFEPVYKAIKAACNELRFEARRVDEIYGPSRIKDDIFSTIVQSRVVISDLTGRNPNVLYETGLAHASNRDVIMIVQNEEDVPFDLRDIRFVKYLRNREGVGELKEVLVRWLQATID